MSGIDDPIFELIPRSTATTPQKKPGYGAIQDRLFDIVSHSTAKMSGQELFKKAYAGYKKPSWNAFENQLQLLNDRLEAEGYAWRVGSTLWYGKCDPEELRRKPRGPFDPST
jgi:hypothetical protein